MRFLANENFARIVVDELRQRGHDVVWARTDMSGAFDEEILERAQEEDRIVLTHDKDFGDLAYHWGLPATCGVVLFRLKTPSSRSALEFIPATLESRADWAGNFAVVEESRIRLRPLPSIS